MKITKLEDIERNSINQTISMVGLRKLISNVLISTYLKKNFKKQGREGEILSNQNEAIP